MFFFYVAKGGERYVSRSYVQKGDDTFIIFTSFLDACCDAPNPGCLLTTRQPAETLVNAGDPTSLMKIGQSPLYGELYP